MSTPTLPPAPDPDDLRAVFMPLALVLLIVGLLDGLTILYSAWTGAAYSSNFYVFALIGAIFLGRGNLFTAGIAMVAAAFFTSAMVGMAAIVPLYMPSDLILAYFRFAPWVLAGSVLRTGLILALLAWAMKRLMHPIVLQAQASEGMKLSDYWKRPTIGFLLGFIVPFVNGVQFATMQGSDLAKQGVIAATKQLRPGEKVYLTSIQPGSASDTRGTIEAVCIAYTADSMRLLSVALHPPQATGSDLPAQAMGSDGRP